MLKASRSSTALHEGQASREDVAVRESSPRTKKKGARQALGDVSNNKARNGAALDGNSSSVTEKRSRVPSAMRSANEDGNPSNDETKREAASILSQNLDAKQGLDSEIKESKNTDSNAILPSKEGGKNEDAKLESNRPCETKTIAHKKNKHRSKKRANSFVVESALLEPRPKRNRQKPPKQPTTSQKEKFNPPKDETKKVEIGDSKVETPNAASMKLPSSTQTLMPSTQRHSGSAVLSDDDYCLPRKLEGPFDASKFTTGIATYDEASKGNVGEVPAYVTDIFQRLYEAERLTMASPNYMADEQDEINGLMRAILVDWLVGLQVQLRLQPETLYLCVNIIDRYLSKARTPRRQLQLVGVTALFVACKYEETYPLEVKDCVYFTSRLYNRQEVLDMEIDIVMVLRFKMTVPTAYPFLQRFLHITNAPKIVRDLASFYTERMLQEYCMLNFRGSLVASAAVCLAWNNPEAIKTLEKTEPNHELPRVLDIIVNYTGFGGEKIRQTATVMCQKLQRPSNNGQKGRSKSPELDKVHKKYRYEAHSKVSYFQLPKIDHLDP